MGGRPRKPTAVKRLQGTLQKCRTNQAEPKPQIDLKSVCAPDYLTDSAKAIWEFSLAAAPPGMLSTLDFGVFTQWVVCFDQFVLLSAAIKETGTLSKDEDGNVNVSNLLHHLTKTVGILRGLETELGFTPASRSKVVSFNQDGTENKSKFDDL
jgi:P27 family predicted phage terminase small subunit